MNRSMHGKPPTPIVFVWDNFGPTHIDRLEAVAASRDGPVVGVELNRTSATYEWEGGQGTGFVWTTLPSRRPGHIALAFHLARTIARVRPKAVFFCHYEMPAILVTAVVCRLCGVSAFVMNDSKFDDYTRQFWRELLKRFFVVPYQAAIVASPRSLDYYAFLGLDRSRIFPGYNAISISRIRAQSPAEPAPDGDHFAGRHFTIVARLVPKKNITLAIRAFALARAAGLSRNLVVCGSGPLLESLQTLCQDLGVAAAVEFRGFVQTAGVSAALSSTLALVLPSTEEQFGVVIAEAVALGVPVLASENCGARDTLVRSGVNGFVFEPDNADGLARMMLMLDRDEALWRELSLNSARFAAAADTPIFVESVIALADRREHKNG
ncbi:MAG: glycosyltransferase [Alphaproteobacteria bacterium]|nr:MAG: glycosyltransferase [Alphaproteobacteria bacterium]